jgi:3-methylfumaryl-CoA hydratase
MLSPLFDHQGLIVSAAWARETVVTGVRDSSGRETATGTLRGSP